LDRELLKKEIQMANKYMKKCSTSLPKKEMQIATTLRFHFTPVRNPLKTQTTTNVGEDVVKQEQLYTVGRNIN
jgi:hypothetical protein